MERNVFLKFKVISHLQALDRRGQARIQLKNYKGALEDFEAAKKADPKTAKVDENIANAKKKMSEEEEKKPEEEEKKEENDEEKKEDVEQDNKAEEIKVEEESKPEDTEEGITKTDEDLLHDIQVRLSIDTHMTFSVYIFFRISKLSWQEEWKLKKKN